MHARLAEGVDSLASAASAMASAFSATVLSRSGSMSRARSPSHSMTLPVVPASARTATLLEDVAASRASTEQKRRPQSLDLPRSASTSRTTASTEEMVAIPVAVQQLAMPFEQAAPVVANDSSRNSSSSSGSRKNTADGCLLQCCISDGVFGVLADMLSSMIEVAAVQEDFRVVLAALELACVIRCQQGRLSLTPVAGTSTSCWARTPLEQPKTCMQPDCINLTICIESQHQTHRMVFVVNNPVWCILLPSWSVCWSCRHIHQCPAHTQAGPQPHPSH